MNFNRKFIKVENFVEESFRKDVKTVYFKHEFYHTLDAKNRLFIPAKFRERLGVDFVILKGPDKCLYAYDNETFEKVAEQFDNHNDRRVQRSFFSQVADMSADKQWRVTLTPDQVKHAGLKKDIVVVGAGKRIEIWAAEEYAGKTLPIADLSGLEDINF